MVRRGNSLALYRDNGKENVSYYSVLGIYRSAGKEDGNDCCILGFIGAMEKKTELLFYIGVISKNREENGNYYIIIG